MTVTSKIHTKNNCIVQQNHFTVGKACSSDKKSRARTVKKNPFLDRRKKRALPNVMVWKPGSISLRHHGKSVDKSGSFSQILSPAEYQVREIASRIGIVSDSEILATVCQKMRKEFVVEEWQLPMLDSRQWEKMNAPIGLAVAVQHLSALKLREKAILEEQQIHADIDADIHEQMRWDAGRFESEETDPSEAWIHGGAEGIFRPPLTEGSIDSLQHSTAISKVGIERGDSETVTPISFESPGTCSDERNQVTPESTLNRTWNVSEEDERMEAPVSPKQVCKTDSGDFSDSCPDWLTLVKVAETTEDKSKQVLENKENEVESEGKIGRGDKSVDSDNDVGNDRTMIEIATPRLPMNKNTNIESPIIEANAPRERNAEEESSRESTGTENELVEILESNRCVLNIGMRVDEESTNNPAASTIITHRESSLESPFRPGTSKDGTPESSNSDTESDFSTNIFRDIGPTVSFSEDEEDGPEHSVEREMAKTNSLLDCHDKKTCGETKHNADTALLFSSDADDITVMASNVTPEGKKSGSDRAKRMRKYNHEFKRGETVSYEIETAALQQILVKLPEEDHRAMLSQLLIMTNAKDQVSRINIAFQAQDTLLDLIEKNEISVETDKAVQLIFHLARLKKNYRTVFGRSIFKAMSKLYKQSEKLKEKTVGKINPSKQEESRSAIGP